MVVALPKVTAPKVTASLDVAMVPFKVTVLPTPLVSNPPLKVKVSPVASPNCKVPSLAKSMSLVTVEPSPLIATLATVLPIVNVVTSTSPESVAVPPTFCNVKVVTPLMLPDAVMSAFAILFSVVKVSVFAVSYTHLTLPTNREV